MMFCERDGAGNIVGVYSRPQEGFAEEAITEEEAALFQPSLAVAAEPAPTGPRPSLWAVAYGVTVADGVIGNIEIASIISGALYMDVGCYWIFLAEPVEPGRYWPKVVDDATRMKVTEKYADYFVITALDAGGNPADPTDFSIEIVRLN